MGGTKKKQRDKETSSGIRKKARINRQLRKLRSKVKRWDRYKAEVEAGTRTAPKRSLRWNTDGLKKHMDFLNSIKG